MSVAPLRGYILVLIGVGFFATSLPLSRWAVAGLDPFTAGVGRAFLGGLLSLATLAVLRPALPTGIQWRHLAYAGVGTGFIFPFFTVLGMSYVNANEGAVVIAILPLATGLVASVIEPERRLSLWFWTGSLLACAIVAAFILRVGFTGFSWGYLALLASLGVGFSYAWAGRTARTLPAWQVISWASVLAMPVQLILFAVLWPWLDWQAPTYSWASLGLGALGAQWAGFFFFYAGLAQVGGARGSLVQYGQPFLTFIFMAAITLTLPDWRVFPYAMAVVAALFLTRFEAKRAA